MARRPSVDRLSLGEENFRTKISRTEETESYFREHYYTTEWARCFLSGMANERMKDIEIFGSIMPIDRSLFSVSAASNKEKGGLSFNIAHERGGAER